MKKLTGAIGSVVTFLVLVGIAKGVWQWNQQSGGGAKELALSIVNGVADFTYRVIPTILDFLNGLVA